MANLLPNSSSPNWNIQKTQNGVSPSTSSAILNPMLSIRSFSALGGGDAPVTGLPRMRSQLFTISTRSVMASHSQINFSYANEQSLTEIDQNIDEIQNDFKQINTGALLPSCNSSITTMRSTSEPNLTPLKRCYHGSMEDLRGLNNCDSINSRNKKNHRKSAPSSNTTTRGQMIEAANELLIEENKHLTNTILKTKRQLLMTKIATWFALEAVKRKERNIKDIEVLKFKKEQQCAARLILHSLLLNSWRNTKRELDISLEDNADLRKSVENFALQVQVLRHVATNERQKMQEKSNLIQNLNDELRIVKEENEIMRKEIEKMENELNSLQASAQNLTDENKILTKEITGIIDKKDTLTQSLERERRRSDQFERENKGMKQGMREIESQLKEATEQKAHWQERARSSESETWELQLHLETRDNNIKELTAACDVLRKEKMQLIDMKAQLKSNLDRTAAALQTLSEKNEEIVGTLENLQAERDAKAITIQELERKLESSKKEFNEVERELLSFKLQNVRRRREWGNALYFIVSPMDAVKRRLT